MKNAIILFSFLALMISACDKPALNLTPPEPIDTKDTEPIDTKDTLLTPPPGPGNLKDYLPLSNGSWWVYKSNQNAKLDTIVVLDNATIFAGKTYARLSKALPTVLFYLSSNNMIRKDSEDYVGVLNALSLHQNSEYFALRPQESKWVLDDYYSQVNPINPINHVSRQAFNKSIIASLTIGANIFQDVLHIQTSESFTHPFHAFNEDSYFVDGVGLIYLERKGNYTNGTEAYELVAYHIE